MPENDVPRDASRPDYPDALMMSQGVKAGDRMVKRVHSVCAVAEPLLGCDPNKNEKAYIRIMPDERLFITTSIHDTVFFAKTHDRDGDPRYRWVRQPSGIEFGYLVPGANDDV